MAQLNSTVIHGALSVTNDISGSAVYSNGTQCLTGLTTGVSGSGNVVTDITVSGNTITKVKGINVTPAETASSQVYPSTDATVGKGFIPSATDTSEYANVDILYGNSRVNNQFVYAASGTYGTYTYDSFTGIGTYTVTTVADNSYANRLNINGGETFSGRGRTRLVSFKARASKALNISFTRVASDEGASITTAAGRWVLAYNLVTFTGDEQMWLRITNPSALAVGDVIEFKDIYIIDIDKYFGNSIPSTLTNANLKTLYPELLEYHEHDEGIIVNTKYSGFESFGANIWDEEWEVGLINESTGEVSPSADRIRSKNFIPVVPGETYYFQHPTQAKLFYYDAGKNFIQTPAWAGPTTFTPGADVCYLKFTMLPTYNDSVPVYQNDIQLCLNSYADKTTYHPYVHDVVQFPEPIELIGYGTAQEEFNLKTKKIIRKFGKVDLGTLDWEAAGSQNNHQRMVSHAVKSFGRNFGNNTLANIFCSKYITRTAGQVWSEYTGVSFDSSSSISIYDPNYNTSTSMAAFKEAMKGVYFYYELANYYEEDGPEVVSFIRSEQTGIIKPVHSEEPTIDDGFTVTYYQNMDISTVGEARSSKSGDLGDTEYRRETEYIDSNFEVVPDNADAIEITKLYGVTRVKNNLVNINGIASATNDGVTFKNNGDGSVTISGTASATTFWTFAPITFDSSHIYLITGCPKNTLNEYISMYINSGDNMDSGNGKLFTYSGSGVPSIRIQSGTNTSTYTFWPMIVDLNMYFGTSDLSFIGSISDPDGMLSSLKEKYPEIFEYVYYNEGEFVSTTYTGIKTNESDNLCDNIWEIGSLGSDSGNPLGSDNINSIRTKNYQKTLGAKNLHLKSYSYFDYSDFYIYFYDAGQNFLSYVDTTAKEGTVLVPEGACYWKCRLYKGSSITTLPSDPKIMVNSGIGAKPYSPYKIKTTNFSQLIKLKSIGYDKRAAGENTHVVTETYDFLTGEKTNLISDEVTLNSSMLANGYLNNQGIYIGILQLSNLPKKSFDNNTIGNIRCNKIFPTTTPNYQYSQATGSSITISSTGNEVLITIAGCDTANKLKAALDTGNYSVIYELANPTTEKIISDNVAEVKEGSFVSLAQYNKPYVGSHYTADYLYNLNEGTKGAISSAESTETSMLEKVGDVPTTESEFHALSGNIPGNSARYINFKYAEGKTRVHNQLVKIPSVSITQTVNYITITDNRDGSYTLNGTATADTTISYGGAYDALNTSHTYLLAGAKTGITLRVPYGSNNDTGDGAVLTVSSSTTELRFIVANGTSLNNVTVTPLLIDLSIYFNGNIPTNASTIEQLQTNYPELFIPSEYNESCFATTEFGQIESEGVNIWDEEWESGAFSDGDGHKIDSATQIRSKNFIRVLPNTQYYSNKVLRVYYYDNKQNYFGHDDYNYNNFSTPSNCYYVKFVTSSANDYGKSFNYPVYKNDIQVCLASLPEDVKNSYHPYFNKKYSFSKDGNCTHLSDENIPIKLYSAHGVRDTFDFTTGKLTRRLGIVELTTSPLVIWDDNVLAASGIFTFNVTGLKQGGVLAVSKKYTSRAAGTWNDLNNMELIFVPQVEGARFKDTNYNTLAGFKAGAAGAYLLYELETPIIEYHQIGAAIEVEPYGTVRAIRDENIDDSVTVQFYKNSGVLNNLAVRTADSSFITEGTQTFYGSKTFVGETNGAKSALSIESNNANTGASALSITCNQTSGSTYWYGANIFAPNMSQGRNFVVNVGKSAAQKDCAYFGYYYDGGASTGNYLKLGMFGADTDDQIKIYGDNHAVFKGRVEVNDSKSDATPIFSATNNTPSTGSNYWIGGRFFAPNMGNGKNNAIVVGRNTGAAGYINYHYTTDTSGANGDRYLGLGLWNHPDIVTIREENGASLTVKDSVTTTGTPTLLSLLAANISTGKDMNMFIGKEPTNKNAAFVGFHYGANGGTGSYMRLGHPGGGNQMVITADGNVGIGTTAPSAKLTVNGDISATSASFSGAVSGATGTFSQGKFGPISVTGTASFSTSATFAGAVSATSFTATSSRKAKKDISPSLISALDIIKDTEIVNFKYINDEKEIPHVGFIAEDTPEILSTPNKDQMDMVNCIGVLLKAVQEITKGMADLEKRIKELENK